MPSSNVESSSWSWPSTRGDLRRYMLSLRLPQDRVTEFKSALGKVAHVCHHEARGIDVNRATMCGSIGKKTASNHSVDLDLVVYVNGLRPDADMKQKFPQILVAIQEAMDRQYPNTRDEKWYQKFGLRYNIKGMDIDILVGAVHVQPHDFLNVLDDSELRSYMSASVSHLSTRFMKKQSLLFHDLVRIAKARRDSFSWATHCKPKSYLLEVIMLEACRRCKVELCSLSKNSPTHYFSRHPPEEVLFTLFKLIAKVKCSSKDLNYDALTLPPLFVCFETYYKRSELPLDRREPIFELSRKVGKGRNARIKTRKATAIVMDPVNPTNNLWLTLGDTSTLIGRAKVEVEKLEELHY